MDAWTEDLSEVARLSVLAMFACSPVWFAYNIFYDLYKMDGRK